MQRTEDFRKGTDTMEREGLKSMDWTEKQLDCRAGREEKSKRGAERSRDVAEKTGKEFTIKGGVFGLGGG